jgi:hypothetical protein
MTAKTVLLLESDCFTDDEIAAVMPALQDPLCPDEIILTRKFVEGCVLAQSHKVARDFIISILTEEQAEMIREAAARLRVLGYASDLDFADELERAFGCDQKV